MQRLSRISQLGMVSLVYPGATHSRMEHSLGVYYNALRFLTRFIDDPALKDFISVRDVDAFVLAALVHDVGHWPYCHPIEDMRLEGMDQHESRVRRWLTKDELADCIEEDWQCDVTDVCELLEGKFDQTGDSSQRTKGFFHSCLSGPVDVDKLDYLGRDSLHAGVPYGRNFDVSRLIDSLCVHPDRFTLAVGEKGLTAAEMMVFSRYIMFSEVYWHHTVRSATAMLQRSVFLLQNRMDLEASFHLTQSEWITLLQRAAEGSIAEPLVQGIFGRRRELYKRVAQFSVNAGASLHQKLARRPYWWLVACSERLAELISQSTGVMVAAADILLDAPPVKLEVDINVDIVSRDGTTASLGDMSPVVAVLAHRQFDDHVKRVRVFVRPALRDQLRQRLPDAQSWAEQVELAIEITEAEWV
ncbi:hypothetical protein Pla52n_58220 [Stieleria varia]|uniref:HD/PDEase domain-containing protein n=2 Tax=Stieleria varia TaxID=2528005 RepID=A0A5C6A6M8_9BACT|nr:hypothetical protein Pla52n_58220 [Stieleria varia]